MEFSFGELIFIGLIAFLVLGPEDFVRFAGKAGKFLGKARDQFNNFKVMAEEEVIAADKNAERKEKLVVAAKELEKKKDEAGE